MIMLGSTGVANDHMSESILVEQAKLIQRHPWWTARAKLTMALLDRLKVRPPAQVLDAGCGWGITLKALEARGYQSVGMDISRQALERLDRESPSRTHVEFDLVSAAKPPMVGFDAVLALDVIEHIDDDRAAIRKLGEFISPQGVVIVSVPALPDMFGEFDRIQGHRRRYLPDTLRTAFTDTGLVLTQIFWWGSWLVPMLRRQRRRPLRGIANESASQTYGRYLRLPPWPAPMVMRAMFAREHKASIAGSLTTGTSLFAIAKRPYN